MKKLSCALLGRGTGPLIKLSGRGRLRITGLPDGDRVQFLCYNGEFESEGEVMENGEYVVWADGHLRLIYEGEGKSLIAFLET